MDEKLSLRYQLLSAWSGPAFLLTFIVFWGILGTNLPAPVSPALNPHDVAVRYLGSWTQMRIGFGISLITVVLYLPWTALLTVQMARIEGRFPVLSLLQLLGGGLTVLVVSLSAVFWAVAAFRPERAPSEMQLLNDLGWLCIDLQYACTTLQMYAAAAVGLADKRPTRLFPRWVCWPDDFLRHQLFPSDADRRHHDRRLRLGWGGELLLSVFLLALLVWRCQRVHDPGSAPPYARGADSGLNRAVLRHGD